jgi:outer membrane autotransporter protein
VLTPTPGWSAAIYATNTQPDLSDFQASHWVKLATAASTGSTQRFTLASRGAVNKTAYTYYLVWITKLPPNQQYAQINEIKLFAPKP